MFGANFFEDLARQRDSEVQKEAPKRPKSPPRNSEEWFSREGIGEWPARTTEESFLGAGLPGDPDSVLGSLEDIKSDLTEHSPWDSAFLEGVDQRLQAVERALFQYADRFICEPSPTAVESVAGGLTNIRDKAFLTELCDVDLLNSRRFLFSPKFLQAKQDGGKSAETAVFPGFRERSSAVPLPGKLEALPILDLVTKTQNLLPYLMKTWRKLFYSDPSCSLFQNTFWWVWMDWFKLCKLWMTWKSGLALLLTPLLSLSSSAQPDPSQQARLFDTIADSFVALLHNMDQKHRDEVFMHYPSCLAQAVYSAFCQAFPQSSKTLNSEPFLTHLTNITSEWIAGVSAPPQSWLPWQRHLLDPHHSVREDLETETAVARAAFTERDVMQLSPGQSRPHTQPRKQSSMARVQFRRPQLRSALLTRQPSRGSALQGGEKSPGMGPGPVFECVRFSVLGRSPLLHHYFTSHHLTSSHPHSGPAISRTQVKLIPPTSTTLTYGELLAKWTQASEEKYDNYEREMARSQQEATAVYRQHIAELRETEKRNQRVLQHRHEVAILAERLMTKRHTLPPLKTRKPSH